jgi:serine-type D-Ala-D-Ala carboxypeptidase
MMMVKLNSETLKKRLKKSFEKFISDRVFPGAVVGISIFMDGIFKRNIFPYGRVDESEILVEKNTFYDCASLTKPLVTVLSLLALIEEKKIFWNQKLGSMLPFPVPGDKKDISLVHLMSHCSGLPAHRLYYQYLMNIDPEYRKKEVIRLILKENLLYSPGEENIYSDLGYILLGNIVEEKSGKRLDEYWQQKVIDPLFLQNELIFPQDNLPNNISFAPTGYCSITKKILSGVVHDDNCRILGGISGHAGLFGTAEGILSICENILLGYHNLSKNRFFNNDNLKIVLKKKGNSSWTLGFDTPSPTNSSSGRYFSNNSVGHLGFTGTSFWIDIKKKVIIVLLSNRVYFGVENEKIKKVRPIIHDLIMEEILDRNNFFSYF